MTDLLARLSKIERLEEELVSKARSIHQPGSPMYFVDLFAIGAANRTLAQSRGFRSMIEEKNFPSAAILLRTQIDTAMRVNGIRYLDRPEAQLREVFEGTKTFRQLVSSKQTKKNRNVLMQDKLLLEWLQEDEPWIATIYTGASDFVHLSFRHLFASIQNIEDAEGIINFSVSGKDQVKGESAYFEICDEFYRVSKLTCIFILGLMIARHAK